MFELIKKIFQPTPLVPDSEPCLEPDYNFEAAPDFRLQLSEKAITFKCPESVFEVKFPNARPLGNLKRDFYNLDLKRYHIAGEGSQIAQDKVFEENWILPSFDGENVRPHCKVTVTSITPAGKAFEQIEDLRDPEVLKRWFTGYMAYEIACRNRSQLSPGPGGFLQVNMPAPGESGPIVSDDDPPDVRLFSHNGVEGYEADVNDSYSILVLPLRSKDVVTFSFKINTNRYGYDIEREPDVLKAANRLLSEIKNSISMEAVPEYSGEVIIDLNLAQIQD